VYTQTVARTIVRDDWKRERNLEAHHFDFDELDEEFFLSATVVPAKKGRLMAIGEFRGRVVAVIFKLLGSEGISIISMRRASRKERRRHGTP
jgi:uncharacterized protein